MATPLTGSARGLLRFRVRFSESVRGLDIRDFLLLGSNRQARVVGITPRSGSDYVVAVRPGPSAASVRLALRPKATIFDLARNRLAGSDRDASF